MANQQGNGRNVAVPDENRPSWRPQDDDPARSRSMSDDDDRYMRDRDRDDRYRQRWEDRSRWDRDEGQRYGRGRYDEDRGYSSHNLGYPSHMEERARERERYSQERGGYWDEGRERGMGGYGHGAYEGVGGGYLGQGGQAMGREQYGDQGGYGAQGHWREPSYRGEWRRTGGESHRGREWGGRDWQGGQPEGMRGPGNWHGMHGSQDSWGPGMYGEGYGGSQRMYQQRSQYGGRGMQGQGGLYGGGGYEEGMYGRGGMQDRYGSQGVQGWEGQRQSHRGKGPSGYTRSDERIRETVCEMLTEHDHVDATNIEVTVKGGEVMLGGSVEDRRQKRLAEDIAEQVSGVKDVQNQIRVMEKRGTGKESEPSMASDKRHRA